MTEQKEALSAATQQILLELARFLLANDLTHKDFVKLSRKAFTEAGTELLKSKDEFTMRKLLETTGLTRNEVEKIDVKSSEEARGSEEAWTVAMRGLHNWHTRTEFVDSKGNPLVLDLTDPEIFSALFETQTKSERGKLLMELQEAGSIQQIANKEWRPVTRYYIPKKRILIFHYFGRAVSRLISTLNRNINNQKVDPWVERMVSTIDLKQEARPLFARVGKEQALRFVESLDDWTSANEVQSKVSKDVSQTVRIGLGVYYFEEKA